MKGTGREVTKKFILEMLFVLLYLGNHFPHAQHRWLRLIINTTVQRFRRSSRYRTSAMLR